MEIKDLNLPNDVSSVLKRDGVLLGTATLIKSYLTKHAKTAALGSKISVKGIAKGLGFVELANAASTTVQQLVPHISEAMDWSMALPFNILNQTIGRIPGIGAIFRWIHNALTNVVTNVADALGFDGLAVTGSKLVLKDPNAGFETETDFKDPGKKAKLADTTNDNVKGEDEMNNSNAKKGLVNHPSFYENLDLHKTFSIPGAYTKKTVVNGTLATPKIVAHRVCENPVPDRSALIDRLNQKFSLIKAVRGLSAVSYDLVDLANYERYAKLNLLQYYVLKKVIQAAKTYSLVQVQIGDNIIDSLGFDPVEVRTNLANYETLLCQWHRFITNNIPMNGTWIERLRYLVGVNIPDYSDMKVATIHMYSVSMTDVYASQGGTNRTFDCIPGARNNSYAVMLVNFNDLQGDIVSNTKWQQLIADYFGAFGSKCMWQDKDYPQYANPLDLRNGDNDLNREQLKNAFYMNAKVSVITINSGVPNAKERIDIDSANAYRYPSYTFGGAYDNTTLAGGSRVDYNTLLDYDCYMSVASTQQRIAGLGSTNKMLLPDLNGVGAQEVNFSGSQGQFVTMNNHETIFTLHKDSYSEGESLEISQFKVRSCGAAVSINVPNEYFLIDVTYKTQEYALMDSTVYTFGSNGVAIVPQTYIICNEAISDDDLTDVESAVDYPDEIMCWALIDWMPLVHYTFFSFVSASTTYVPRDIALIDMDAFGSLDDRAFVTSINYSVYSLQGANLKVDGKTRRVSNLADVYKDKPSKRG